MQVDKNEGTFDHRLIGYQQVDLIISITDHFINTFNDSASNTCTDCLSRQTHRAAQILSAVSDGVSSGSCSFLRPTKTTTVFAVVHLCLSQRGSNHRSTSCFLSHCLSFKMNCVESHCVFQNLQSSNSWKEPTNTSRTTDRWASHASRTRTIKSFSLKHLNEEAGLKPPLMKLTFRF